MEVCVAAGLTLLPDIYSYDYGGHRLTGTDPEARRSSAVPVGLCRCPAALEAALPAGIDLNPLDPTPTRAPTSCSDCYVADHNEHSRVGTLRR